MRSFSLTLLAAVALSACAAAPKPVPMRPCPSMASMLAAVPDVTAEASAMHEKWQAVIDQANAMLAGPEIQDADVRFVTPVGWTEVRSGIDGFGDYTIWVENNKLSANAVLTVWKTADYSIDSGDVAFLRGRCEEFKNSVAKDGGLVSGVTIAKRGNACSGTFADTNDQGYYRVTAVPNQSRFLTTISAGHADVADTRAVAEAMTKLAESLTVTFREEAR